MDPDGWPNQVGQEIEVKAGQLLTLTTRGGCFGGGGWMEGLGRVLMVLFGQGGGWRGTCSPSPRAVGLGLGLWGRLFLVWVGFEASHTLKTPQKRPPNNCNTPFQNIKP